MRNKCEAKHVLYRDGVNYYVVHDSNGHGQLTIGPTKSEARDAYIKLKRVGMG